MKLATERSAVQNPLIEYAHEVGWQVVSQEEALKLRCGETGLLFKEVFSNQILKLNSNFINASIVEDLNYE